MKTFRIILTDNGPEFKDPWSIEQDKNGKQRTKVFYCDLKCYTKVVTGVANKIY